MSLKSILATQDVAGSMILYNNNNNKLQKEIMIQKFSIVIQCLILYVIHCNKLGEGCMIIT